MEKIVVTRHKGLVQLLLERGLITEDTPVIEHAKEDDVRDKHVVGVLPLPLAAAACMVTEIPIRMTIEERGKDLSVERLREIAGAATTYVVYKVPKTFQED